MANIIKPLIALCLALYATFGVAAESISCMIDSVPRLEIRHGSCAISVDTTAFTISRVEKDVESSTLYLKSTTIPTATVLIFHGTMSIKMDICQGNPQRKLTGERKQLGYVERLYEDGMFLYAEIYSADMPNNLYAQAYYVPLKYKEDFLAQWSNILFFNNRGTNNTRHQLGEGYTLVAPNNVLKYQTSKSVDSITGKLFTITTLPYTNFSVTYGELQPIQAPTGMTKICEYNNGKYITTTYRNNLYLYEVLDISNHLRITISGLPLRYVDDYRRIMHYILIEADENYSSECR